MASKTLRELSIKLDADIVELKKDLAKANNQLSGFGKKVEGMGKSLKAAFSIGAIVVAGKQLYEFGVEVSALGKELEGVKAGFAGIDPQVLQDMKKATHGTVTELELMKAAVQAKNFGLPVEKLGTMLEFVHRRARASGESVDYLTKSLVTGLGRKSAMIIDNLGISTSQLNTQLKKTPDFTTAVAEIMKRDMLAAGDYIETAADITQRWAADWENSKAQIGLFINKGIKLIAPIIDGLRKDFSAWFSESSKQLVEFINEWITLYNESILFRGIISGLKLSFKIMWESFKLSINLMIDAVKMAGKSIMFALNPKNWGEGFSRGIDNILAAGFIEMAEDSKKAGENIGTAIFDAIDETANGKRDLITFDNFVSPSAQESIVADAAELGTKAANALHTNMKDFQKGMSAMASDDGGDGNENFFPDIEADADEFVARVQNVGKNVRMSMDSVANFMADSFAQLGENIGKSLTGMGTFFDGFLNIILDFGKQFGKMLIAVGVAKVALEKIAISGVGAIIAGTALIAAMSAVGSIVSKGPGFAGGGIVPGSSFAHDKVPIMANSNEMVLNSGQQSSLFRMLNNGGGGNGDKQLVAKLQGSDLLFVIEEAQRKKNNSY